MARISTHVLDTSRGVPAEGIAITLERVQGATRDHVASSVTNADGRTASPLVSGNEIPTGIYEITFHAEAYFTRMGLAISRPPFLGEVVIRFGVSESTGHYHVPLLLSPYGYSTYRGS